MDGSNFTAQNLPKKNKKIEYNITDTRYKLYSLNIYVLRITYKIS